MTENADERYEAFMVMVRRPAEGPSWFDCVYDLITANCKSSETEPCTCGLETMSGTEGTYDQCIHWPDLEHNTESVAALYDRFALHVGHKIKNVYYGFRENVALECIDCNEILIDVDNPDLSEAPEEGQYNDGDDT